MKKLKRILPIILACVLLFGSCLSVNASSAYVDLEAAYCSDCFDYANDNRLPIYEYYAFFKDTSSGNSYMLVSSEFPLVYEVSGSTTTIKTGSRGNAYTLRNNSGNISVYNKNQLYSAFSPMGYHYGLDSIYANYDMYAYDSDIEYIPLNNSIFPQQYISNIYNTDVTFGSILITAEVGSTYSITLPATLALSKNDETGKYEGEYIVGVKANLTESESITVTPAATFTLSETGGTSVEGSTVQTVNIWKQNASASNEIESDYQNFVETKGKVSANLTKAGTYNGTLDFTFAKVTN